MFIAAVKSHLSDVVCLSVLLDFMLENSMCIWDLVYSCAPVDKSSTHKARCIIPLMQQSFLSTTRQ